jgi:hypothetical protein
VTDERHPGGLCYNYGTADFSTPVPLTIDFIRGRAKFWVSTIDRNRMVRAYEREDRTVWRQRLPLSSEQAELVANDLARAVVGDERYYRYHHYDDNCTTRIRDLIDRATGGELKKAAARSGPRPTLRDYTMRGFAGNVPLLVVSDLVLGRAADREIGEWEAMFLPEVLMNAFKKHLGAEPIREYARRGPPASGSESIGRWLLALIGMLLAAVQLSVRRMRLLSSVSRRSSGLFLGIVALVPWILALVSDFRELRVNEVVLVLVPLDLLIVFLRGRWLRGFLIVRLAELALVLVLSAAGVLVQPLIAFISLVALPLAAALRSMLDMQPAQRA